MARSEQQVVTQADVARRAGVHRATVSRALDPERRSLLDADTVARVLAAVDALGYRPNRLAQGLRRQRSSLVGLVVPDLASAFAGAIAAAFEPAVRAHGLMPLVLGSGDRQDDLASVATALASMRADAAVVATERAEAALDALATYDGPIVLLGAPSPRAAVAIEVDEAAAVELAAEHLLRLGHRRIGLIAAPPSSARGEAQARGYARALAAAGIPLDPHLAIPAEPSRVLAAREACGALLEPAAAPTGIVVTDDGAALGCIAALRDRGLDVPGDVSVVGLGNAPFGRYLAPALTTVSLPLAALGRLAADVAAALAAGEEVDAASFRPPAPYLVQRGTTAPPKAPPAP